MTAAEIGWRPSTSPEYQRRQRQADTLDCAKCGHGAGAHGARGRGRCRLDCQCHGFRVTPKGGTGHLTVSERFWIKVRVTPLVNGCWTWNARTSKGYGHFRTGGRLVKAHRFSRSIRFSKVEDAIVSAKATKAGLTFSEYVRDRALGVEH